MKIKKTQSSLSSQKEIALDLLEQLSCPRSLTVAILLRYGQHEDILAISADPLNYADRDSFFRAYQATKLLSKASWLPTTIDKKAVAVSAFLSAERDCEKTNDLFRSVMAGTANFANPGVKRSLSIARRKVHHILRGVSEYAFLDHCGFGPGADLGTRSGFTSAYDKLQASGQVTRQCSKYLDFLAQNTSLCTGEFSWDIETRSINTERVLGNRITFVPKNSKTDRSIAVEPRWNIFFQKGMGRVLRQALRRSGIDLDDQSVNQKLALSSSISGSHATLDLKGASDSVSSQLINYLLPARFTRVLDDLRSQYYSLNGEEFLAHKWSSMGNGYTFELESLVFHALCWSVCGDDHSVYGDDLIVPSNKSAEVVELLRVCGFQLNREKSFTSGPFRESCGGDYFLGSLVTPIYWKDPLDVEGTLRLVNQVSVLARRISGGHLRDHRFRRIWTRLVNRLPASRRFFGPSSIATVVHSPLSDWCKPARFGWDGWELKIPVFVPLRFRFRSYAPAVLSQWFQPSSDGYSIRDRTRLTYKTVFIPVSGFEDVGTWG